MADHSRAGVRVRDMEPVTVANISSRTLAARSALGLARHGQYRLRIPRTGMAVDPMRLNLDSAPVFADEMRRCDAAFTEFLDWSLLEAVRGGVGSSSLDRVDVAQPVLFAVMVSLAAQWRALGIPPDAVLGHSQGEVAAAYVAGALSLRDAAKVVTLRSKAISAIAGDGGMVSIAGRSNRRVR